MTDLDHLLDNRSDPDARAVLEDFERSRYRTSTVSRLGCALSYVHAADDDAATDADAAAATAAADDAADDATDDDDDDDAATAAADDPADDDDDGLAGLRSSTSMLLEEPSMHDGLKIVLLRGRYGYGTAFVCWFRRVQGDEWQMLPGSRHVYVTGARRGLAWLAKHGPGSDYQLREPSEVAEAVHRLVPLRVLDADEKAWADYCPRPKGWT